MPQFDYFSFLNQVSWFLIFFFNFYFFITYFLLPKICYNLKFRKKKINFDINKKIKINFEKHNISIFFNNSYKKFCSNFELFIFQKLFLYKETEKSKIQQVAIFNFFLKKKLILILSQKFLLLKKVLILI